MAIPPVSFGIGEGALLTYYRRIVEAIRIPVIVQDAGGYVGKPMPITMQAQLLDEYGPERVQYKPEASPIGPNHFAVYPPSTGRFTPVMYREASLRRKMTAPPRSVSSAMRPSIVCSQ